MISPLIRKLLAATLFLVLTFAGIAVGPLPYLLWVKDKQASIAHVETKIERLEVIRTKAEQLGNTLETANPEDWRKLLIAASSPSIGGAGLQGDFTRKGEALNLETLNLQALPTRSEGALSRVGFRASFRATVYDFLELLKKIENDPRLLIVDNIRIRVSKGVGSVGTEINVQMELWGLMESQDGAA